MEKYFENNQIRLYNEDSKEVLRTLPDNCIDAIVTDPPYGISFMGQTWDYNIPSVSLWKECLRVLKPGGYLLSFASTKTQHRMAVNIEDAGFIIKNMITWMYGSGMPKGLDIGKAVDKELGNQRKQIGIKKGPGHIPNDRGKWGFKSNTYIEETKGETQYEGYNTQLKPCFEPITMAQKGISEQTITKNCLKWNTGGLNIDGCRIQTNDKLTGSGKGFLSEKGFGNIGHGKKTNSDKGQHKQGRYPANIILDGSKEVTACFPCTGTGKNKQPYTYDSQNSAARFFYCAKATKKERNEGLTYNNSHATVKPIKLMQYLCRLVMPQNGVVLDPFMGSGTTGKACMEEGFSFVGIDKEEEYCKIAKDRILYSYHISNNKKKGLFTL